MRETVEKMDLLARHLPGVLKQPALRLAHGLLLARLRIEARLDRRRPSGLPRLVASASWAFPVYSQTFAHQEVLALAQAGFPFRFLYARLNPRDGLAHTCDALWALKRRVLLHTSTGALDLKMFRARMPGLVDALTRRIADAAGMRPEELERHEHFLHAFSFARAVEAWEVEYLHSYFFYEQTFFALVASQLLGIPRGVSCYADHMLQDYPLKLVKLHLETSDVIVATSRRIRSELETIHGASLPQLIVKANAIDVTAFRVKESRTPWDARALRLLSVSRIDPKKGIEYLIEAMRLLAERGVSVEGRILGAPDAHSPLGLEYEALLRRRAAESGLAEAIHFGGRQTSHEVAQALDDADIFVAPYVDLPNGDKDGIPTAALEAMAAGSVIVATDAGSIREIIDDGQQGLIVPQRNASALADALQRLREDPELARRLGAAGAARARSDYDIARSEGVFHERIRRVVDARGRRRG